MNVNKKKIINSIGSIGVVICLIFLIKNIIKQKINWGEYLNTPINLLIFIGCILILAMSIYFTAFAYRYILKGICDQKVALHTINRMYITSNIGKYLPGNVMHFVGRNLLSVKYDIPQDKVLLSTILELLMIGISCLMWISLGGKKYIQYVLEAVISNRILLIIGGLFLCLCIIIGSIFIYFKRAKFFEMLSNVKLGHLLKAQLFYFFICALSSITYCLVIYAIAPVYNFKIVGISFITYMLAWLVGFITPGAPGGIGVREVILQYFLGNILGNEILLVSIIIHRVLTILGDFMAFSLQSIINKLIK